jgi:hypothetical protein
VTIICDGFVVEDNILLDKNIENTAAYKNYKELHGQTIPELRTRRGGWHIIDINRI